MRLFFLRIIGFCPEDHTDVKGVDCVPNYNDCEELPATTTTTTPATTTAAAPTAAAPSAQREKRALELAAPADATTEGSAAVAAAAAAAAATTEDDGLVSSVATVTTPTPRAETKVPYPPSLRCRSLVSLNALYSPHKSSLIV